MFLSSRKVACHAHRPARNKGCATTSLRHHICGETMARAVNDGGVARAQPLFTLSEGQGGTLHKLGACLPSCGQQRRSPGGGRARLFAILTSMWCCFVVAACASSVHELPAPDAMSSGHGEIRALSVGRTTSCVAMQDGAAICWLQKADGSLEYHRFEEHSADQIETDGAWGCLLTRDGTVGCWGEPSPASSEGQPSWRLRMIEGLERVIEVVVGQHHACALNADGRVDCWGDNSRGQRGVPLSAADWWQPERVVGLDVVQSIAAGASHSCAWQSSGRLSCWGDNRWGQLGVALPDWSATPIALQGVDSLLAFSLGSRHSCVLQSGRGISCWGTGIAVGEGETRVSNRLIVGSSSALSLAAGSDSTCWVEADRLIRCVGADEADVFLAEQSVLSQSPLQLSSIESVHQLAAGFRQMCAVLEGGALQCWGAGGQGQRRNWDRFRPVEGLSDISQIQLGDTHSCAFSNAEGWQCWGSNCWGELGEVPRWNAAELPVWSSQRKLAPRPWAQTLALGRAHSCAIESKTTVSCWGQSQSGECGVRSPVAEPTSIALAARRLAAAGEHSCAIDQNGAVLCWGNNERGQLGLGGVFDSVEPVLLSTPEACTELDVGATHSCAVLSDGSVWCWGDNSAGQLGREPQTLRLGIGPMTKATEVEQVSCGFEHSCVLYRDGRVGCVGANTLGQLGDGTTTSRAELVLVEGLPEVQKVLAGFQQSYALLLDGRLAFWGSSFDGMAGDGEGAVRTKPMILDGLGRVVDVQAGARHVCVLLANGELWCSGANELGQCGVAQGQAPSVREILLDSL